MIKHNYFVDKESYRTAFLIKENSINKTELKLNYDIEWNDTIILGLPNDKIPAKEQKAYIEKLIPILEALKVEFIFVTDGNFFKTFTNSRKIEPHYGSVLPSVYKEYSIILSINYKQLFYSPKSKSKLDLSVQALNKALSGKDPTLGLGIIHSCAYPSDIKDISEWLNKLLDKPLLACDIETYGLALKEADIASISFSWSQHDGIAFLVNDSIKQLLKEFFINYTGKLVFHNASFDIRNIIYRCFMTHPLDLDGMYLGLDTLYRDTEDTKIIAYLATNSTEGNELSLKSLALEYAGNYGILEDDADVTKYSTDEILKYNLIDTLSTIYVLNKYKPLMIKDNQLDIYSNLLIPSLKSVTLMELVGMPLNMSEVSKSEKTLSDIKNLWHRRLLNNPIIKAFNWELQKEAFTTKNAELKTKYIPIDQFQREINPNSGIQVSKLLFDFIGLEPLSLTKKGNYSTDEDALKEQLTILINKYSISEEELYE